MAEILANFPGAKRALFARYHIGGCQSCSYADDETLAAVCERNENLPIDEVIAHIRDSHEEDQKILIEPADLAEKISAANGTSDLPRLLDLRTREEHEAVALPNSELFSNELLQEIFGTENKERLIVLYDHTGDRCLDAAAYLLGHGFKNTRALRGGIDAYAQEANPELPRYKLEFEE
ncbi:MAG: rhodanese-like domain-containing protein [Verrucomicrobiales bacterium]|nr:rhodanese-like domain-containing protein [Verrucomicrobiales bacterium]